MSFRKKIHEGLTCDSRHKPESVLGRAVCLASHPGKMILLPFFHWFEGHYAGRYRFARATFAVDLVLIGIAAGLLLAGLFLSLYHPKTVADKIFFDVSVAPSEIISGAPSTLVIRYTNGTEQELRDVTMSLSYPAHFELQEVLLDDQTMHDDMIEMGDLDIGETGSLKITGVMFGDVGGEQTFRSVMTFAYGENDRKAQKVSEHTFSPSASTLALSLELPKPLIAYQNIEGTITYQNTGEIDYPEISIEPEWPEGFTLSESNPIFLDNHFSLPSIKAGEEGTMTFKGFLATDDEQTTFIFHPSFTFGNTLYRQETLNHSADVLPPQVSLEATSEQTALTPGNDATITVSFEHIGTEPIYELQIALQSDDPFVTEQTMYTLNDPIDLEPGETGTATVTLPLTSYVSAQDIESFTDTRVTFFPIATYTLGSEEGQNIDYTGEEVRLPITTPVTLESFGRYTLPSGEQLGRGPLPPRAGQTTKYWIFWHVTDTIHPLTDISISGTLGDNVTFTGRQTVSQNSGVTYDPATNTISWSASSVDATLDSTNPVIGIAFEVAVTPSEDQVGSAPILITNTHLTASDQTTGTFVTDWGSTVTTSLPQDTMAGGYAEVIE